MANKDNKCDKVFESASKSTLLTAGPTVCLLITAIVIIILSAIQAFTIVDGEGAASVKDTWTDRCAEDEMGYLSPFHFQVTSGQGGASYGCQWRPRNTIFRFLIASITILTCATSLLVLLSGKFETLWPVFYWLNWLIFVMMFVIFILDCDAINTGVALCRNDFEVDGNPLLRLDLNGVATPVQVEKCKIDPFIWTALADLIASMVAFCAYKISRYYIFDPNERKASIAGFSGKIKKNSTGNNKANDATDNDRTSTTTTQQLASDTNNTNNTNNEPDPFADYHGGYDVSPDNGKDTGGSAYGGGGGMSAYDE